MKEIKCTIIQDVLPLYTDGVVSRDTKEMVEKHLIDCENCQKEYELLKQDLYFPANNKVSVFKKLKKTLLKKRVFTSIISILLTAVILFGAFLFTFYYEKVIPYADDLIKIKAQNESQLVSYYYGESYAGVNMTHPMQVEVDGEVKLVSFIYYTKTFAESPERSLIDNGSEQTYTSVLPESEKIDAVYYAEFDPEKITAEKDSWESVIKRAALIWER
ncbi:Putative zinc-finger [Gracilibacillus ureilyticus]|uniref:Putative zinc-finger n=1 Tax=Gracilibacillus ureilyticus TaxID=531814 RepID=A0A1H9V535_9BACI|nr:zf-HC2 domain-containing protein [Gracilibacillus ureilyticus]SES16357.1 Putative zinc-finger [Gracilibacillus ureilyticus]